MKNIYILIFVTIIFSCEQKKNLRDFKDPEFQQSLKEFDKKMGEMNNLQNIKKYSIVVFEGIRNNMDRNRAIIVSDVLETPLLITKDEEYKTIDQYQASPEVKIFLRQINKRYIKHFDTYSEASKEKERLLGINQSASDRHRKLENQQVSQEDLDRAAFVADSASAVNY